MISISQNKFDNRFLAQAEARAAMVERFRKRPAVDDPAVLARNAERKAAEVEAAAERARAVQAAEKAEHDARYAARKTKIKLRR